MANSIQTDFMQFISMQHKTNNKDNSKAFS